MTFRYRPSESRYGPAFGFFRTSAAHAAAERHDLGPHPLSSSFDFPIADVRVAQRHPHIAVTEQPGDHRQREALDHGVARERVAQAMEPGFGPAGLADARAKVVRVLDMTGGAGRRV